MNYLTPHHAYSIIGYSKHEDSSRKSSCDSSEGSVNSQNAKYKTQLCRTYAQMGRCNYGPKCHFAHGSEELVNKEEVGCKRRCNGFWTNGCCSYGSRCRFGHQEIDWQSRACLLGLQAHCSQDLVKMRSKLLKILL